MIDWNEINLVDHPFKREVGVGPVRAFDHAYFDEPGVLGGFGGYRLEGNEAEGRRDFVAEARQIASLPGVRTVLDVGCAKGFLVGALRDVGLDARGVDVSRYAVEAASPSIRPYLSVGALPDLPAGRWDVVSISGVLIYLELSVIREALRRVRSAVDVGVVIDEPTRERLVACLDARDVGAIDPLRKQELPATAWRALIEAAGFEAEDGWYRAR